MSVMGILIPDENKIRVSLFVHFNNQPASFCGDYQSIAETTERRKFYDNSSAPN
jgi:hypothetical protein